MKSNNQVRLNSEEIKDLLKYIINNNRALQKDGKTPISVEVIGEAGLGKTSVITQVGEECGLEVVKLNLAQIEEIGDLVGFPIRQFKMVNNCKKVITEEVTVEEEVVIPLKQFVDGKLVEKKIVKKVPKKKIIEKVIENDEIWVDETAISDYIQRGYKFSGERRMGYCPPEWIADKKEGGILLLDDWTRGDNRFIQAVMELIDRQKYISWQLPKDWHIILTSNPDNGQYMVNTIDQAQRTRFISIIMKWDVEKWAAWAERTGIDERCINFLLMNPEIIESGDGVNPRSMTIFFNSISSIEDFESNLFLIQNIGEGSVGPEVSNLFTTFIANRLDKLISPKRMLLEDDDKTIIRELINCIGSGVKKRLDIASLLVSRFVNYASYYAEKNAVSEKIINRIIAMIKEEDLFTNDLKYIIVKKLINANKQKFQKILFDKQVQEFTMK